MTVPPPSYRTFRVFWTVLHLGLLLAVAAAVVVWWSTDANGSRLTAAWWAWAREVQATLYYLIPLPGSSRP